MRSAACLLVALMLVALMPGASAWAGDSAGNLTVTMEGFQNDDGVAMVSVFAGAAGFPYETGKAVRREKVAIRDRKAVATFAALPFGSYAVAMFHDNDLSGVLEKNLFGIPRKGYGLSNNPTGSPSFDTSRFTIDTPDQAITITLKY